MGLAAHSVLVKIIFLLGVFIVHGRPFEGGSDYAFALLAAYFLVFGFVRERVKPILVTLGLALLALGHYIPQLAIPEQARILLDKQNHYISPAQFLEETTRYPYRLTADGYLQGYKDKRLVKSIDIDEGILSLRSGWVNRPEYNFYELVNPPLVREELPFVVSYEIVPQMIGMTLTMEGLLIIKREGRFRIHGTALKTIHLQEQDIGSTVYGFGGKWDETGYHHLIIKLNKTLIYRIYDGIRFMAFFIGLTLFCFGLFLLHPTIELGRQSVLLGLSTLSFWIFYSYVLHQGVFVKGGGDGVKHGGFPYQMLDKWAAGDWWGALMSPEPVFYFMPGMRYVRFLEMLLFGDSYILQVCVLLFVPIIFYRFFCVFLARNVSLVLALFMFAHMFNGIGFSIKLYLSSTLNLYGEGFAYALLFISITLLAQSIQKVAWGFIAFFLSAVSITIRPNLGVFCAAIAAIHLFTKTFSTLPWASRIIMLFGLSPVLLIPIHNILGGEFVLLTKASQIPENLLLTPGLYLQAICSLIGVTESHEYVDSFVGHFRNMYPQYIVAWLGCLWLSFKGQTSLVKSLALATFAGLSVHFFYLPDLRYLHPYLTIAIILGLSQISRFQIRQSSV